MNMKKSSLYLTLCIVFAISVCLPVCALSLADMGDTIPTERLLPHVTDEAGLLWDSELTSLEEMLDEIYNRQSFEVAVVTVDSIPYGYSVPSYADDVYDYFRFGYGDGRDGCLLLISMEERDYYISTHGYGITALSDSDIEYIGNALIYNGLSDGDYASAFYTFAELCDQYVTYARSGGANNSFTKEYNGDYYYDYDNGRLYIESETETNYGGIFIFSLIIGIITGFIGTAILSAKMKSVRHESDAAYYKDNDSFRLRTSRDSFLYSNVSKTKKPEPSSSSGGGSTTHTSSSGSSHGGGGGKF